MMQPFVYNARMKTITIISPTNVEIEYRLAGAGSRAAAFIIDLLIQSVAIGLLVLFVLFGLSGLRLTTLANADGYALAFLIIACFTIFVGYYIVCEMGMKGQTVGKRIFKLRVLRDNGQPVGFSQSLVRGLFRITIDMMYVGIFSIIFSFLLFM